MFITKLPLLLFFIFIPGVIKAEVFFNCLIIIQQDYLLTHAPLGFLIVVKMQAFYNFRNFD